MKQLLCLVCILILCLGALWVYFAETFPETSPEKSLVYFAQHLLSPHAKYTNEVIGFLPYWRLGELSNIRSNNITELNYFSLSVGPDGHLLQVVNNQTDPGWNGWIKQETKDFLAKSQIMGTKVTVTVAAQDNQLIQTILNSNSVQENLISDLITQMQKRKFDGLTIDFEYTGEPDTTLQEEFTYFSKKLANQLKQQNPKATLSLSIMPLSARQKDLYNFSELLAIYDRFIGMSYDYYGQSSDIAGPVAPINGFKQGMYFFDVTTTYTDYLKYLPKNKLIMGVPTYGWEWAVANGKTIKSPTYPADSPDNYAAVISYARARVDADLKPSQCQWDVVSEETWCWFTDKKTGIDHQAWIADNNMIQTRFDYANKENFKGIALWTLGLDKNYPDIWDKLSRTFGK